MPWTVENHALIYTEERPNMNHEITCTNKAHTDAQHHHSAAGTDQVQCHKHGLCSYCLNGWAVFSKVRVNA
jgi:hypothetical protein